jgi:hypothetical protein
VGGGSEYTPIHVCVTAFSFEREEGVGVGGWAHHYTGRHKQYSLKSSSGEASHFRVIFLSSLLFFLLLLSMREKITLNSFPFHVCLSIPYGRDNQTALPDTQRNSKNFSPSNFYSGGTSFESWLGQ